MCECPNCQNNKATRTLDKDGTYQTIICERCKKSTSLLTPKGEREKRAIERNKAM